MTTSSTRRTRRSSTSASRCGTPSSVATPRTTTAARASANLRHALSMAINRQELIDQVFDGAFAPADSLVSPVVQGYREGACGEWCEYDVEAAKALYEESDKIEGTINFWFNEGAVHDQWLTVVGNYWNTAFGIEYELQARVWADYLQAQSDHALDGPFRLGWVMDYPSAQNYLAPIYGEGSGESATSATTTPRSNELLSEGNSAATIEEGLELYNQAEDLILDGHAEHPDVVRPHARCVQRERRRTCSSTSSATSTSSRSPYRRVRHRNPATGRPGPDSVLVGSRPVALRHSERPPRDLSRRLFHLLTRRSDGTLRHPSPAAADPGVLRDDVHHLRRCVHAPWRPDPGVVR